jgi:hypothetical protein
MVLAKTSIQPLSRSPSGEYPVEPDNFHPEWWQYKAVANLLHCAGNCPPVIARASPTGFRPGRVRIEFARKVGRS